MKNAVQAYSENPTIIMDNFSLHHTELKEFFEDNSIGYKYLSAYSPDLNPIENVFSNIKARLRAKIPRASNQSELVALITEEIYNLERKFENYYTFRISCKI